jgi:hypothetical protein
MKSTISNRSQTVRASTLRKCPLSLGDWAYCNSVTETELQPIPIVRSTVFICSLLFFIFLSYSWHGLSSQQAPWFVVSPIRNTAQKIKGIWAIATASGLSVEYAPAPQLVVWRWNYYQPLPVPTHSLSHNYKYSFISKSCKYLIFKMSRYWFV